MTTSSKMPSRVDNIISVATICTTLALLVFGTRLWVRLHLTRAGLGLDDWTIGFAMITAVALAVLTMIMTKYGWGHHTEDLGPGGFDQGTGWKMFYSAIILYITSLNAVKISILCQLQRIALPLRKVIYLVGGVILAFDIGASAAIVFQCIPVSESFTYTGVNHKQSSGGPQNQSANCIDFSALFMASGVIAFLTDIVIFFLPMRILWTLKLPLQQRMGLLCIFSLGLFAVLAGLLRLRSLKAALDEWGHDPHWTFVGCMLWSIAEVDVTIVCACLACMKPLFSRFFGKPDSTITNPSIGSKDRTLLGSRRRPSIPDIESEEKLVGSGGFPRIYRTTEIDIERSGTAPPEELEPENAQDQKAGVTPARLPEAYLPR